MIDVDDVINERVFKKYIRGTLPLDTYIYLKLVDPSSGGVLDIKTLRSMVKEAGYEVSRSHFLRTLMKMEVRGVLYLEGTSVKLVKEKRYLVVDED